MIQTTAKKHKSTLVVLFGVSALCVVAPATADQVDQAVTEILERPVELHAPTGIYMPDEAQSRKFIDEHGVDIKSMQDRVARARAEQEQTLGIRPDQRVIERPKSRLMVFVSTSIPRESLNRLIDDAGRAGAVLMIKRRGGASTRRRSGDSTSRSSPRSFCPWGPSANPPVRKRTRGAAWKSASTEWRGM